MPHLQTAYPCILDSCSLRTLVSVASSCGPPGREGRPGLWLPIRPLTGDQIGHSASPGITLVLGKAGASGPLPRVAVGTWPRWRPSAATRPRSLSPCSVGCAAEARGAGRGSCSSPPATPWLRSQPRGGCGACASPAGRLAAVGQRGVLPSAPDREKVAPSAPPSLPPRPSVTEAVRKQALIRAGTTCLPAGREGRRQVSPWKGTARPAGSWTAAGSAAVLTENVVAQLQFFAFWCCLAPVANGRLSVETEPG